MLVSLKDMLADARARRYAVPAFDCTEDVMVRTILQTCQDQQAPVILMALEMDLQTDGGKGWIYQAGLIRAVADRYPIPIGLHLDHARELDAVKRAVDLGFTSVMIDGSRLPLEDNIRLTRAVVDVAAPHGVAVEGELGHVGGMDLEDTQCAENVLTEPDQVTRFVAQTGVDALAVSIGTAHGVYRALPRLNIARLKELNAVSSVPLVLHGGSGTPEDQIRQAVRHGISKANLYADLRVAMYRGVKQTAAAHQRIDPLPKDLFQPIRTELAAVVEEKIELLGARGRANRKPSHETPGDQ